MSTERHPVLPVWFWLGLPLLAYFGQYIARAILSDPVYSRLLTGETGITEQATPLILALCLVIGLRCVLHFRGRKPRLALWFGLFALGCLYFGGEEASWGQHWFGWATPADWQALNNQDETNLHNSVDLAGALLDQLPRNLLSLAVLVGGGILPLWRAAKGRTITPGTAKDWIMPDFACVPAGLIAPLASIPEKIMNAGWGDVPWPLDIDAGEVKELMLAVFLLVYITAVWARLPARQR